MKRYRIFALLLVVVLLAIGLLQPAPLQSQSAPPKSQPALPKGLSALPRRSADKQATFFMGRVRYSKNNGNDCTSVGKSLLKLVSEASTIQVSQDERILAFTDPVLYETPFLFMNGHNDFVLSETELQNLATYFAHGGFLFTSGCCTNPAFPQAWRREMGRIFPNEQVKTLPYDHPIYRSSYRISRIRSLHENRDIYLEGLFHQGNLVAVMCEDGLCCAFAMENKCNVGKGVSPADGKKLALNIAIYALTH